jgi:hypothetical protein
MTKIFLDTCSINALSGLDNTSFAHLRNLLEESNSELWASHIQVDERYTKNNSEFGQMCEKAFEVFEKHGLKINLGKTKGGFYDISRYDEFTYEDDLSGIYKELENELKECMKEKGKYCSKPFDEKALINNIRDCLIAVTSTDYDYFITSDECLFKSWEKVLQKSENRDVLGRISDTKYVEPNPEKILKLLSDILGIHKQM